MTGEGKRVYEARIEVDSEDEAQSLLERLSPPAGWALEERDNRLFLLAYFYGPPTLDVDAVVREAPDWEKRFRDSFRGVEFPPFFIRPPWVKRREGLVDIVIYPGSGFGTGEHPSTQCVLKLISDVGVPGKVLDVGCGSGILSIAAVKLGAGQAVALDIDPLAVSNAKENIALNSVKERVLLVNGTTTCIDGAFPLVMANIDFFTLVSMRDELLRLVEPGGVLVISGFLEEDEKDMAELYRYRGFHIERKVDIKEWAGLAMRRGI